MVDENLEAIRPGHVGDDIARTVGKVLAVVRQRLGSVYSVASISTYVIG